MATKTKTQLAYEDEVYLSLKNMAFEVWYPIKNPKGRDTIKYLFALGIVPEIELNVDETKVRKVDIFFETKQLKPNKGK